MSMRLSEDDQKKLPFALACVVDQACDRFEGAWRAGQRPAIEDFLAAVPPEAHEVLLVELIGLEVRYRRHAGETPQAQDYTARFPAVNAGWLASVLAAKPEPDTVWEVVPTPGPGATSWPVIPGYDILGVLGEGGMGVVYQARHRTLQRLVAVKMILPSRREDVPALLARFRAEAEAQARLQHPNIVQIFEVGEAAGRPYLALEYLDGGSLDRRLAGTPQPPQAAARLVEVLARAMHAAHQCQIVHRDLKPANILLQTIPGAEPPGVTERSGDPAVDLDRWIPKITDFGVAKFLDVDRAQTQTGMVLGTASYMAPEQARGRSREIGPATDTYALGAILYELLTGRPPFKGASPVETLEQVVGQEPVSPKRLQPKVPADLATICLKCLEKERGHRYASALALAEDLRRFQAGEPILGRRPGLLRQGVSWCRRNPALAAASGLALTALGAVVVISLLFGLSERALQRQTESALAEAKRMSFLRGCDQGLLWCQRGDVLRGLNGLARSHQEAPAGTDDYQRVLRANLAAWHRQLHPLRDCLEHSKAVRAVAVSPDGRFLATAGDDGVRLWHLAERRLLHHLPHPKSVRTVAFRPDSQLLATGGADGIRLWSLGGDLLGQLMDPEETLIRTSAVGLLGAPEGQGPLLAASYLIPGRTKANDVWALAFSPDGQSLLAGGSDKLARLWDIPRRTVRHVFRGHNQGVVAVAFSPDGQNVLTGSRDLTARLWEAASGRQRGPTLWHPTRHVVWAVAFSPDGQSMLTGCHDGTAILWDVAAVAAGAAKARRTFRHQAAIRAAAFDRSGKRVVTGSADATARLWDVTTGRLIGTPVRHRGWVLSVAWSPDNRLLVTGSPDATVRLWDVAAAQASPRKLARKGWVNAVAFSPTDDLLVTASRNANEAIHFCNAAGQPVGAPLPYDRGAIEALAFSPNGKMLVTGTRRKVAQVWDVAGRRPLGEEMVHPDAVLAVAFYPDSLKILTGCNDGWARVWDAATGRLRRRLYFQSNQIHALVFSPDGRTILSGGINNRVQRYDAATGQPVGAPFPHEGVVNSVAFSPDGRTVATGGQDCTARLWKVDDPERRCITLAHDGWVWALAFSPDGQTVVTASSDNQARLWDVATGLPIGPPLPHQGPVRCVAFSPDGRTILTGSWDKQARLWEVSTPVAGDGGRILLWAQLHTGMEVDQQGRFHILGGAALRQRRQQLEVWDGPALP